jgi:hypothetical protein
LPGACRGPTPVPGPISYAIAKVSLTLADKEPYKQVQNCWFDNLFKNNRNIRPMIHLKFKKYLFLLILCAYCGLPAAVCADDARGLGWLYERIDVYRAIEHNKKRIQLSKSEAEKKRARKLLLKNYAKAIDSEQGERRE